MIEIKAVVTYRVWAKNRDEAQRMVAELVGALYYPYAPDGEKRPRVEPISVVIDDSQA